MRRLPKRILAFMIALIVLVGLGPQFVIEVYADAEDYDYITIVAGENGLLKKDGVTSSSINTDSKYGNTYTINGSTVTYNNYSGVECSIEAVPNEGYMFDKWTCDGQEITTGHLVVGIKAEFKISHTHDWQYSAVGNKLEAYCANAGCPSGTSAAHKVTLTLTATSPNYSGTSVTVCTDGTNAGAVIKYNLSDWTTAGAGDVTVKYVGRDGTTYDENTAPPTKLGKYTVTLYPVSEEANPTHVVTADFEIKTKTSDDKKVVTCSDTDFEYTFYKNGDYVSDVDGDSSGTVTTSLIFYNASGETVSYSPITLGSTPDDGFSMTYVPADIPGLLRGLGVQNGVGIKCNYSASTHTLTVTPIAHTHTWAYSTENSKLIATCTCDINSIGYDGCDYKNKTGDDRKVSLTLTASDADYSGGAYTGASLGTTTSWTTAGLSEPVIKYVGRGGTTYSESTTAPTEVGTYTAKMITAGGQTASVDFEITKATRAAQTVSMSGYTFGATVSPSLSGVPEESATPAYYYNTTDSNSGGTAWTSSTSASLDPGNYYVYAVIPATTNYNAYTTATTSFTVTGATLGTVTATTPTAVTYDGATHGISPVTCATEGVTVKYGTASGTYNLTTAPTFTDAGTHTVYYEVTKHGYTPETGSVDVVINPKEVTVSGITAVNKNYDGNTTVTLNYSSVSITGKVTGDDLSVTATGTLDSANAGDRTVTISGITLTGAKASNYTLAASGNQTTTTATVNKVALTLSEPTSYAPTNVDGKLVIKQDTSYPLITASTNTLPDGITTEYKLDDGGTWSPTIPTATGVIVGTHKVYYRFVRGTNYNPLENSSWYVEVEVAEGSVTITATGATCENLDDIGEANKVEGKDVTITLSVATKSDATVTNKTVMESKVDNVFNGSTATKDYLDIHINKAVVGEETTQITNTTTPIEIAYSYALDSAKAYVIIRDHNGTVTAFKQLSSRPTGSYVDGTYYLDFANNKVYIYSKYFSDYMIASAAGHSVVFNSNGGSAVDQMIVSDGATIASLPTPTRSGYTFNGWYSDAGLSTAFTTTTAVSGDITVYAKWAQNSSGGSSSSDSSSSAETSKTTTVTVNVTHTVVKGDTMSRIARKYGLTLAQLAALNPQIKNINRIYPGQLINVGSETKTVTETETKQAEVKVPSRSVTTYIVKKGDTLIKIARNNRMSLAEIAALNGQIKNLHWIYPGQVINIRK